MSHSQNANLSYLLEWAALTLLPSLNLDGNRLNLPMKSLLTHQPCTLAFAAVISLLAIFGSVKAAPLRIMPLGDSITAGYTDNSAWTVDFEFGYRSGLYTRLTNAGYNFTYVGGSPEPWVSKYGDPTRGGTYKPTFDLRDIGQETTKATAVGP